MMSNRQRKLREMQTQNNKTSIRNNTLFRNIERQYKYKASLDIEKDKSLITLCEDDCKIDERLVLFDKYYKTANPCYERLKSSGCEIKTCYKLKDIPDCIIIKNPFTKKREMELIKLALKEYTKPKYFNNLNVHYKTSLEKSLFEMVKTKELLHQKIREKQEEEANNSKAFEGHLYNNKNEKSQETKNSSLKKYLEELDILRKLRWVSIGCAYNWKDKKYDLDNTNNLKAEEDKVGKEIKELCEDLVDLFKIYENYTVQTGIINFYQTKDSLMAHVDKSELNMEAPLVSIR